MPGSVESSKNIPQPIVLHSASNDIQVSVYSHLTHTVSYAALATLHLLLCPFQAVPTLPIRVGFECSRDRFSYILSSQGLSILYLRIDHTLEIRQKVPFLTETPFRAPFNVQSRVVDINSGTP